MTILNPFGRFNSFNEDSFSKEQFLRKVDLATRSGVEPTTNSVLSREDIDAVEFLYWAEVDPDILNGQLLVDEDQVRTKGLSKTDINDFADALISGDYSYSFEQPFCVETDEDADEPFLTSVDGTQVKLGRKKLLVIAGRTRKAGHDQANYLIVKEGKRFRYFTAVVRFKSSGGEPAEYWQQIAQNIENSPNKKSGIKFIKNYQTNEDCTLGIIKSCSKSCNAKNIDLSKEKYNRAINKVLKDNLVPEKDFAKFRNLIREHQGVSASIKSWTEESDRLTFASAKKIKVTNLKKKKGNKVIVDDNGFVYLIQNFNGSGPAGTGVKDLDYDERCIKNCTNILQENPDVKKIIILAYTQDCNAQHIRDIRDYKKDDMVKDKLQERLDTFKAFGVDTDKNLDQLSSKFRRCSKKIEFWFFPQICGEDNMETWA